MRVLVLSAYDAGSHAYWRQGLAELLADWDWHSLTLPPRHFSWRVRGNPLSWARREQRTLDADWDLLLATSMVDLATLRGLVPGLATIPTLYYFHENQFAYPDNHSVHGNLEAQMVSLYGALAADALGFNSRYNRDSFLAGVAALLRRLPDHVPPGVVDELSERSEVLPVPLRPRLRDRDLPTSPWAAPSGTAGRALRLVWPGRLEYDRGGEGLERILPLLDAAGVDFELALVGQSFRRRPAVFERIAERWSRRLVQLGWLEARRDYLALLRDADIVLSTTRHEFQGIAVAEAVQYGCYPVLPSRLAYPERYPEHCLYESDDDPEAEAAGAAALIQARAAAAIEGSLSPPVVDALLPGTLLPAYRRVLLGLAGER